ncbi:MAG: MMPL family transporter [Pirellulaceae bacterium]
MASYFLGQPPSDDGATCKSRSFSVPIAYRMQTLAKFVSRRWWAVMLFWAVAVALLRGFAPAWDDVTHDGNLAFLPADRPSVIGEQWLEEAFPYDRAKSQIVIVVAREDRPLEMGDFAVGYDLARRFRNLQGAAAMGRAAELDASANAAREKHDQVAANKWAERADRTRQTALAAFDEAVLFDELLYEHADELRDANAEGDDSLAIERLAEAYWNRALVRESLGEKDAAAEDRRIAMLLDPESVNADDEPLPHNAKNWPLLDVWTWRDGLLGKKLGDGNRHARLIILQLSNEFMDTGNMQLIEDVERVVDDVRRTAPRLTDAGLRIGLSGSAAIGGDMRRAAAAGIKNTELFTLLLVLVILTVVYRSPLLVAVPLISIAVAFLASTSLVALLTQLDQLPGFSWWSLKIFTTSRIFIVAILFGAGTDYCLFLIARYREELAHCGSAELAVQRALSGVGDALAASALTTILGLAMMWFADFGKFHYTGPMIGLCLVITLLTCVTLTPALLRVAGKRVFWPTRLESYGHPKSTSTAQRVWQWMARAIVTRPGLVLCVSLVLLAPLAGFGYSQSDHVTYDFAADLSSDWPSRQGTELLEQYFPVGESGPLTVLVRRPEGRFDDEAGRQQLTTLTEAMYVDGVKAVRSLTDPLGEFRPGQRTGASASRAWRRWMLAHRDRTNELFVAQNGENAGKIARFDIILRDDPFSVAAAETLARVDDRLHQLATETPMWRGVRFAYAGTTAGIRDLRAVTRTDNARIQILVVAAVFLVLLVILRRPVICVYMMATVLLSYYVTMGLTHLYFGWVYGDSYQGLDWKAPLFLFVILVAVGQDYNVYLATRVFEEQGSFGLFAGLRRAIVSTGGIITSCGVIMAGTFVSMTSGSWAAYLPDWLPGKGWLFVQAGTLRGIAELGFALALGVLLDTFVVRPVLVPAFMALQARWMAGREQRLSAAAYAYENSTRISS